MLPVMVDILNLYVNIKYKNVIIKLYKKLSYDVVLFRPNYYVVGMVVRPILDLNTSDKEKNIKYKHVKK